MRKDRGNPVGGEGGGQLGLRAALWQVPLTVVLELVHATQRTGLLRAEAELDGGTLPLEIQFVRGEVTAAAILDWQGLEALYSFPQATPAGWAEFWQAPAQPAPPLAPFQNLLAEWARLSDEWPRCCEQIRSPSQRFYGEAAPFNRPGGASARWVAAASGQPLHEVCTQLAALQQAGFIQPIQGSFEWDTLVVPACQDSQALRRSPVLRLLDGRKSLHRLLERGLSPDELRSELLSHLGSSAPFPGSGRALRDWLWEQGHAERDLLLT